MPVGAWELEYGCTTLADPNRVAAYVANAQDPAYCVDGVNELAPVPPAWTNLRVDCNCWALGYTTDSPGQTPYPIAPYTTPQADIAPWYSALNPESAHFYGFMIERVEEIATPPVTRSLVDRVTSFGGGSLGTLRRRGRNIKFTLLGFGAYEAAMDYGFRWLSDVLTSESAPCDLCEMTVRTACPPYELSWENWDTGRWTFKQVGLIDGPRYEEPPNPNATCNVRRVSFVMTASVPYAFKCPVEQAVGIEWIADLVPQDWNDLSSALLWLDADATSQQSEARNLGVGGPALNGIYGPGTSAPAWLDHTGTNYIHVPRHSSNYLWMSVTDSLNLTSNFDVSVRVELDDFGTSDAIIRSIISKGFISGTRSWEMYVRNGLLGFRTCSDGSGTFSVHESTVPLSQSPSSLFWLRVAVSSTSVTFYTADDSASLPVGSLWTQLGSSVALSGTIFSVDSDIYMGRGPYGTGNGIGYMNVYRAVVRDNGTTVLDADATVGIQSGKARSMNTLVSEPYTISQLSGGGGFCIGLTSDGKVLGWGSNSTAYVTGSPTYGMLGLSEPVAIVNTPVWIKTGDLAGQTVQSISCTGSYCYALRSDGKIVEWGWVDPGSGTSTPTPTVMTAGALAGATVTKISAGEGFMVALLSTGQIATWGYNSDGQLGNGTTIDSPTPTITTSGYLSGKTVVDIFARSLYCFALLSDGTVAAWGANSDGQLADGTTVERHTPVQGVLGGAAVGRTIIGIRGGWQGDSDTCFALTAEGDLLGWGDNALYYQLGIPSPPFEYTSPILVANGDLAGKRIVDLIHTANGGSIAITDTGEAIGWGPANSYYDYPFPIPPYSPDLTLTTPTTLPISTFTGDSSGVQTMALVDPYDSPTYVAVMNSGRVFSWGGNSQFTVGNDTAREGSMEAPPPDYDTAPLVAHEITGVLKNANTILNRGAMTEDYVRTIAAVVRPIWLFAAKQYIRIPHNSLLDFGTSPFTVSMIRRVFFRFSEDDYPFPAPRRSLISKLIAPLSTTSRGWKIGTKKFDMPWYVEDRMEAARTGTVSGTSPGLYYSSESRAMNVGAIVRRTDGYSRGMLISPSELDDNQITSDSASIDNTGDIYIGYNPLDPTSTPTSNTSLEVSSIQIWDYAHTATDLQTGLMSYLLEDPNTASPGVDWFCNNESSACVSISPSLSVGEDALVIEVNADPDRPISDLVITVTPDPFGYVCDPTSAPAGYVTPDPCDTVYVRELPAGYVFRYDATTQSITVTSPGGLPEDGTPYLDVSSGVAPSFPSIRGGAFCVCVSSARCSFSASTSNFSVWTVHQELGL